MENKDSRYSTRLLIAFAVVVITFVLGTLYENWRTLEIGAQTRAVSTNALPSIEDLVAASDALREIEVVGARYPGLPVAERAAARTMIESKWEEIDRQLTAYLNLSAFEGERAMYAEIPAHLRSVDEALRHMYDDVDDGNLLAAQQLSTGEVQQTIGAAIEELHKLTALNATQAYAATERIETLRARTTETAIVLDGIAVLVAIVAMGWVLRLFRVHTRLLRDHGELVERRANELEIFGKRVAHDLLSPLSALTYCLGAFKKVSETDPALQDAMSRARTCVQRAQGMVDGIFEFARAGGRPATTSSTDVLEAIEQVAEEVRQSEARDRPEIEVDAPFSYKVACSHGVLVSVLTNLMRNASKYMSDSPVRKIAVRVRETNDVIRIQVEDTGPGVAPELREAIFEPYVRAEGATQPGLGLGLATVKRLCVAHGGEVGVKSTLGQGSTFWVTLPKSKSTSEEAAPPSSLQIRRVAS
jgi:signal transduction histidine kinase